ncbi:unnamed protein product [Prorocentrum cordatum]|uniref:Uncharacterized protein n=1 Tax=Prorocentrum cordatum TaxID=2364126 RepID=A0ABN9SFN2_9DINO|nr:unnamed protein product [Polarella glacialis]
MCGVVGNTLPRFASQARDFRSLRLSLDLAPPAAMVNEGPPTPEAVNAAMEDVPTTGPLASSYRRTLREMKKKGADVDPDGPVHFKLCGALKKLGLTKIDMRTFREWADRVTQFVKEEREVWLVQKEAFPDVGKDKKVSFWLLGPSEAQGVDHDRVWVLDAHAPTGPYMRGAIRRTIGWKATKDRGSKKPRLEDGDTHASGQSCGAEVAAGSGPAAAPQGMAPAPAALAAASSGMAPGGAEAAPERKRRKTLAEHVSSEDNDDVSIKTLRLDCQKACEAGRFYVPGETDTAHFRAKMYVGYLKKQKAEHMKRDSEKSFADELSVESRYFFQYLADWILKGKTHEVIGHFAPLFREAKELHPALVPKIAQAICSIGEVDLLGQFSGSESELEKYGLPPKHISALAGSPFLAGFRKARFEAQFALAKTASSWRGAAPGPAAEQPGGEQPGGEQPGGEQPDGEQPGGVQPGGEQPGGEQPGGERPGGEQPGGEQPGGESDGSAALQAGNADSRARLELIISLLGNAQADEQQKKELEFAKAMMTNSPGPRLAHLMKMALDEFSLLEAWFPGDPDQVVGLLLKGVRYKDCAIQNVVNAIQHVVKGGAQESLVNPVVRGLGALYVRLNELQAKEPKDMVEPEMGPLDNHEGRDRSQEQRSKFMASIFAEVASLRLGAVGFTSKARDYTGIPSKMLQEVHAMASSAVPLVTPDMPAHALMWCHRRVVEELGAKKKLQQELANETAGEPQTPSSNEKITTGGFSQFLAFGGPYRPSGPPKNDSGRNAGPREWVETSGGRRHEKIMTSGVWGRSRGRPRRRSQTG